MTSIPPDAGALRASLTTRLAARPQRLLALWLGAMHLGLLQGPDTPVGRTLMLVHLGLFLIWQPVVRGAYRLGIRDVVVMVLAVVAFVAASSWSWLALWVMVLAGVVGGEAFIAVSTRARLPYQLAVAYLVCCLFIVVLPQVVPEPVGEQAIFEALAVTLLPLMIVGVAFAGGQSPPPRARAIDFLSAMLVLLVLGVTSLGALVFMWLKHLPYVVAILSALSAMAGALIVLAWAWHPHLGGPQLGAQIARRLLSAGLSVEEWLDRVAALSLGTDRAEVFLQRACEAMLEMPGVAGGRWRLSAGAEGRFGEHSPVVRHYGQDELTVTLCLQREPSPAMDWHLRLMVRLLAEFCREKRHARELETLSYLRAVHETGARLTHDVKNLLQSLNTLCFTATRGDVDMPTLRALVGRQLPVISARLGQTLEKLRDPAAAHAERAELGAWWQALQERHAGSPVGFDRLAQGGDVPLPLFGSAADNLIQNALEKHQLDARVSIQVRAGSDASGPWLEVEDSGWPVEGMVAGELFDHPVHSDSGLGMGLYQVARQAEAAGYRLRLADNRTGCVRFRLDQAGVG
ncbi:sensor histidine kinase [Nitrogeniibacter mangrovi]|uniref:Sensor histidine kinase n=1 Tax=Nitrogeniibacter mangrovi TaxID=2016596 RepID=A0A6C1B5Q3_9RHOO|nr:sensor histidine kinase [Nitrogeniibacter mangrovi]QID18797.1 sensor histidine kinase [Nitrogeniibacter mangrovi]